MWAVIFLVLAVALVSSILIRRTPNVAVSPEARMVGLNLEPGSSYEQKTNHFQMTPVDMGPVSGSETPFRVNLYNAYME